jgi:hypothetical protein
MKILNTLQKLIKTDNMTPKEKEVAQYVVNNPNKVVNYTIRKLAAESGTSTGSILRVVKKTSNEGFNDFKNTLIKELANKNPEISTSLNFQVNDFSNKFEKIMTQTINSSFNNLKHLLSFQAYGESYDYLENLYDILENSLNLILYGETNEFEITLSNIFEKQGYINKLYSSNIECEKAIKNLNLHKQNLESKIKLNINTNGDKENSNLKLSNSIILVVFDKYTEKMSKLINIAEKNDFEIIIIGSSETHEIIDSGPVDFFINLGDIAIYENHPTMKEHLTFYIFLEYLRIYYQETIKENQKYN